MKLEDLIIPEEYNLIGTFKDDQFAYHGYDHLRYTARALLENDKGEFGFLHIVGEDFFGKRDHLESCGGGIEEGESFSEAIVREIKEETGYIVDNYRFIGSILDTYNLINRITLSTFFHVNINPNNKENENKTEEEKILIKEFVWLKPLEALDWLENKHENKCDILVQRRDALVLRYYLEKYTNYLED